MPWRPSGLTEVLVGTLAAAVVLATGGVTWTAAGEVLRSIAPVVAFLIAILVLAEQPGRWACSLPRETGLGSCCCWLQGWPHSLRMC